MLSDEPVAQSYLRILDHFGAREAASHILIWGCSATVMRHDALKLGAVFDEVTYHKGLKTMISDQWLCPVKVTTVKTGVDLRGVRVSKGDFASRELSECVNTEMRNRKVIETWLQYAKTEDLKSTLVFGVDIAHVNQLKDCFRAEGIHAEALTSLTGRIERVELLRKFRGQQLPVLINCAILTEGTDVRFRCF